MRYFLAIRVIRKRFLFQLMEDQTYHFFYSRFGRVRDGVGHTRDSTKNENINSFVLHFAEHNSSTVFLFCISNFRFSIFFI